MAFKLAAQISGHEGAVTSLATTGECPDLLVSGSRDKSVMVWKLTRTMEEYAHPQRRLHGHSHFVESVKVSNDGRYALSGSWDGSLRLWDLTNGTSMRRFVGHTKDVLAVALSADNRQIVSCGRDRCIKLWNTLGDCKYDFVEDAHTEWVSDVAFSPNPTVPVLVSCGWDRLVKVWSLDDFKLKFNLVGHTGYINTVCVSPEGSLCASAGKDGQINIWDLKEGKSLYKLDAGCEVYQVVFNPTKYWLCAATAEGVKVFDLEKKACIAELTREAEDFITVSRRPVCLSVAWSADSNTLFAGYSDSIIRAWEYTA